MARARRVSPAESLARIYQQHRPELSSYQWENENGRWHELVVSALTVGPGLDLSVARRSIALLEELNVLSVDVLRKANPEVRKFIATIFHQAGARPAAAVAATTLTCAMAANVYRQWNGHVHRLLRMFAAPMTREVMRLFEGTGVSRRKSRKAAVLWLQNVSQMPVLLPDDPHVEAFLQQLGIEERELLDMADHAGLNLAVLDDLLLMEHRHQAGKSSGLASRAAD